MSAGVPGTVKARGWPAAARGKSRTLMPAVTGITDAAGQRVYAGVRRVRWPNRIPTLLT